MWGATGPDVKATSVDLTAVSEALTIDDAYENFVLALLGTLLADVVKRTGAIPLDNRTVLLPHGQAPGNAQDGPASASAAATFRVYLTPAGSLVIGLALFPANGFLPLDKPQLILPTPPLTDTRTLVAPFGVRAFYQGAPDVTFPHLENGTAQTPDTQVSRLRESRSSPWRQVCTRLLERKGLSVQVLESSPWITIKIPRQKYLDQRQEGKPPVAVNTTIAISWPACLCFRKQHAALPPVSRVGGNTLVGYTESYDPMARAKAWFQETPNRTETQAKRKREREAATTGDLKSDHEGGARQQATANSPLTLPRAGNVAAAAAGVMYPTPPDGVPNPAVPTPSLDGAVSSPQQAPPTVSVVDTDVAMSNTAPLTEELADRERNEVPYLGDSDNLFDDLGGDMFNDAELTDADFTFFDEPAMSTDVQMEGMALEAQPHAPQAAVPEPSHQPELPPPPLVPSANSTAPETPNNATSGEPAIKRESPVFAKPELRHARSSMKDGTKSTAQGGTGPSGARPKRERSPFDPDTVFKRVRTALYNPSRSSKPSLTGRKNAYDTVEFDRVLYPVNSKYVNGGKFAVNWKPTKDAHNSHKSPPTTEYLKRHGKPHKTPNGLPENHSALIARITSGLGSSSIQASPTKLDTTVADAEDSSPVSDQDDSSVSSEEALSPVKSAGPRRPNYDDDMVSQATSLRDVDLAEESDPSFALELPRLGKAGAADIPLHKFFADPEPLALQLALPDEDMIAVAQVLTEQAALGSLAISSDGSIHKPSSTAPDRRQQLAVATRQTLKTLKESLSTYLNGATECQLKSFAEIHDGTPPSVPPPRTALQPRPVPGRDPDMKPPTVYQIPSPHLEVKRAESRLSVLPSAISFWESLGLGPSLGPKDVQAACVFPGWDGMADNVSFFLDRVKNVYESMKLGSFERLPSAGDITDGIVHYDVDKISVTPGQVFPRISSALAERIELLCQTLRTTAESEKNFVIYFIYSPSNPSSIVEACTAFHQLSESFNGPMSGKNSPPSELALQLVPLDLVSSSSSLVIQPPAELAKLCLETYDRCALPGGPMPAPSIALEEVAPRYIDFSLTSNPSPSVMYENSCIHVAYARSVDGRWVTAAWTDLRGRQQMMASYCLGRKSRPLATPFNDVAHEIWETTHDLISVWKVHWRVVITKCGAMESDEMEFWTGLAQTEAKAKVSLVLLAVDTAPSMQLIPPAARINPSVSTAFYSTPASTPQPSILSPEQSGNPPTSNAPTPGDPPQPDGPPDGILVDTLDQSWACILSHRLPTSTAPAPLTRSLFSGYLVKRGGTRPEDPPVVMEVNVLHSDGNPRQHEGLLREMLGHFRALGTLSRARGVSGAPDVRPWHVAAAEKGVRALYLLM